MGIIIIFITIGIFLLGVILGSVLTLYNTKKRTNSDIRNIQSLNQTFKDIGFDFSFMLAKLMVMSLKAQATFAYQYAYELKRSGNTRLISTVKRYLDNPAVKSSAVKQKEKAL